MISSFFPSNNSKEDNEKDLKDPNKPPSTNNSPQKGDNS